MSAGYTVRVVSATDAQKPVSMRDHNFDYKNQALNFINRLGKINAIRRMGRVYVVTPGK